MTAAIDRTPRPTGDRPSAHLALVGETAAAGARVLPPRALLVLGTNGWRTEANRDLATEMRAGRFREDLYYRLNGATIYVPALRERRAEIRPLALHFAQAAGRRHGIETTPELDASALAALERYRWPGNVRELRNVVERAVVFAGGGLVTIEHLPPELDASARPLETVELDLSDGERVERERILEALARCAGNQKLAAEMVGLSRRTFVDRLDAYAIPRPRKRGPI